MTNEPIIVIREYKSSDSVVVSEVVRNAYLTNVNSAWYYTVLKEVRIYHVNVLYLFSTII